MPQGFVVFSIFCATLVAACQERSQIRRVSLTDAEKLFDEEDLLLSSFQVMVPWQHWECFHLLNNAFNNSLSFSQCFQLAGEHCS